MLKIIKDIYIKSEYSSILSEVNGLVYPFNNHWDKIAIGISGGADSALLTTILCNHIIEQKLSTQIHLIHNIRCWKTRPWQKCVADNVINYFISKFNSINFKVHYNFVPPDLEHSNKGKTIIDEYGKLVSGDTIELRSFAEYTCFQHNISAYFNAVTKNPNVEFTGEMTARNVELNDDTFRLMIMKHLGFIACHPFRFVDKSWIMSTYKKLQLDDLLSITRSCEGDFSDITYETYTPGQYVPLCNTCFWCKERNWGIEQSK
jgi:hypothetical protein